MRPAKQLNRATARRRDQVTATGKTPKRIKAMKRRALRLAA